ncbi:MAG: hypothetical protein O3B47_03285 [bacterium]|nr:hypothetical protein [bacterium]
MDDAERHLDGSRELAYIQELRNSLRETLKDAGEDMEVAKTVRFIRVAMNSDRKDPGYFRQPGMVMYGQIHQLLIV